MKLLLLICFVCSMWIDRIRGQVFTTQGNEYPSADIKVIKCFCNETLNEFGLSQPLNSTEVLELYQRGDDNGLYNLLVQNGLQVRDQATVNKMILDSLHRCKNKNPPLQPQPRSCYCPKCEYCRTCNNCPCCNGSDDYYAYDYECLGCV